MAPPTSVWLSACFYKYDMTTLNFYTNLTSTSHSYRNKSMWPTSSGLPSSTTASTTPTWMSAPSRSKANFKNCFNAKTSASSHILTTTYTYYTHLSNYSSLLNMTIVVRTNKIWINFEHQWQCLHFIFYFLGSPVMSKRSGSWAFTF